MGEMPWSLASLHVGGKHRRVLDPSAWILEIENNQLEVRLHALKHQQVDAEPIVGELVIKTAGV